MKKLFLKDEGGVRNWVPIVLISMLVFTTLMWLGKNTNRDSEALVKANDTIRELQTTITTTNAQKAKVEGDLKNVQADMVGTIAKARDEAAETARSSAEQELGRIKSDLSLAKAKIAEIEPKLKSANADLALANGATETANKAKEAAEADKSKLQAEVASLQKQLAEAKSTSVSPVVVNSNSVTASAPIPAPVGYREVIKLESGAPVGGHQVGSLDIASLMHIYIDKCGIDVAKAQGSSLPAVKKREVIDGIMAYKQAYMNLADGVTLSAKDILCLKETIRRKEAEGTRSGKDEADQLRAALKL